MKVAYIEATCRCQTQGFGDYARLPDAALRAVDHAVDPIYSICCATCGELGHVRAAELIGHEPIAPLEHHELDALMCERESLRAQIAEEELSRPYVWPSLMERHDALECVEELSRLELAVQRLERDDAITLPSVLARRQELRAQARELLATATI